MRENGTQRTQLVAYELGIRRIELHLLFHPGFDVSRSWGEQSLREPRSAERKRLSGLPAWSKRKGDPAVPGPFSDFRVQGKGFGWPCQHGCWHGARSGTIAHT